MTIPAVKLRDPATSEIPSDWDEWLVLFANRDEVAREYAACLGVYRQEWRGWRFFNEAILRRWSPAGLRYIKTKAWNQGV